jgi:enamine deaminase RidA (YjgF/YER057c/UK114 family)
MMAPFPTPSEFLEMTIQRIEPGARMSGAVVHGNTVYLSGQTGSGDDVQSQARSALAKVDELLAKVGSHKSKILQATIWLRDMADFAAMNPVWEAWIDPANPPARATGEARLASPGLKFEVIIVAALD